MGRKPRSLDEIEREIDKAEDLELAMPPAQTFDVNDQRNLEDLERFDHIFSVSESATVKKILAEMYAKRTPQSVIGVDTAWRQIPRAAHQYEKDELVYERKAPQFEKDGVKAKVKASSR